MELKEKTDNLLDHAGDYVDTYYKLTLLNISERATRVSSSIIGAVLMAVFILFFLLFVSLALSWWIGGLLNSIVAGYFIVAGVYLLVIFVLLYLRKKTIDPFIRNFIVKKIYE